jgi:hypothetical protein
MLTAQFILQDAHFTISLLAALALFAAFGLHFDAWTERRVAKELFAWIGFLLLSISFLIHATHIESGFLGISIFGELGEFIASLLRIAAYTTVIYSLLIDPIQQRPENRVSALIPGFILSGVRFLLPVLSVGAAFLYLRKVQSGLEKHLTPIAYFFLALAVYELLGLAEIWRGTTNVFWANFVAPFGPIWILEHLALLAAVVILARWVWQYLTSRLFTQVFMTFIFATVIGFLLTTVTFTSLLIRNIEETALDNLATGANVLTYALSAKESEALSAAQVAANDVRVSASTSARDHNELVTATNGFLESKGLSSLIVVSDSGQVLLRAEDTDRWGDSLSEDIVFKRTVLGEETKSMATMEATSAPSVLIRGAVPIRSDGKIVGVAIASVTLDNSFVDGIKSQTGLDSAIYAGNVRSATTFLAPDGKSRNIGIKEENEEVKSTVLDKGETFRGVVSNLGTPYLSVYGPLKDVTATTIGMLYTGSPQAAILQTAGRSVELTFLAAVALILLAIIPAYKIAKYLTYQLK